MSGLAAIVLPPLELEDVDLGLLALAHDLGLHRSTLEERGAGLDRLAVGGEEDLVEGHLGARRGIHERQAKGLTLLRAVLLAEGSEDRVHEANPLKRRPPRC